MISKASAPGKVILFGEHFVVHGVKAILCAIDKRIIVKARKNPENVISIKSNIGNFEAQSEKPIHEIQNEFRPFFYLAKKMMGENNSKSGMEITIDSQIPQGVGLGSSSACCVAGAAAISGIYSKKTKEEVLKLAIEAEKTIFPNTSGADCTVSTFGGLIQYEKKKGHSKIQSKPDFHLVIANSKVEHSTKEVVSTVSQFKDENENEFSKLCIEEEKIIENVLVCIKNNDWKGIGVNIMKNQEFLETIGISNEKLREMIKNANKSSYGAKITGAGGGGCIFALTDDTNLQRTLKNLKEYECFSAKIDYKGLDTF
ncbi:MAG: mevalonate kinase [Nitrosopumilaceae archaeon]|nr:mevalonate kinase [Nitrosopumilaceae archaeon]